MLYLSLFLVFILAICPITPSSETDGPLQVQLTVDQVKGLCEAVKKSQIVNDAVYQWVNVKKQVTDKESNQECQDCIKIGFTPCIGEARYPLTKDCGFYGLVPDAEKFSTSSRSKRSVSTKPLALSHGDAMHLCHTVNPTNLPKSPDQTQYVSVKINIVDPKEDKLQTPHPSEKCVSWAYKPCQFENQVDCDEWKKIVEPAVECVKFNSENPADHPQRPMRPKIDQQISTTSLPFMDDVIRCQTAGSGIECKILTPGTEILTPEIIRASHREKRSPRWGRRGWGSGRGFDCCCPVGKFGCLCGRPPNC